MLSKLGVDISRLKWPIREQLPVIDEIFIKHTNQEAIISSTYEGDHSPGSLHYADLAIDLRLPYKNRDAIMVELKQRLNDGYKKGKLYDILFSYVNRKPVCIHIEYDPG